jgi:shikimate kinase
MGTIVFVTGVPSSGKSAVTRELLALDASFRAVETDVEIRKAASDLDTPVNARAIFQRVLDQVAELARSANVVVDGSLPASYVTEARDRFGEQAVFVTLQIAEVERRTREQTRDDRKPIPGRSDVRGASRLLARLLEILTRGLEHRCEERAPSGQRFLLRGLLLRDRRAAASDDTSARSGLLSDLLRAAESRSAISRSKPSPSSP